MFNEQVLISKMKMKYKKRTYREISQDMNLNQTRVFRIFNGSKISYQEGLKMHQLVGVKKEGISSFINDCNQEKINKKIYRLTRLEKITGLKELS